MRQQLDVQDLTLIRGVVEAYHGNMMAGIVLFSVRPSLYLGMRISSI